MANPLNQNTQPTDDTVRLVCEAMVESDRLSRYYGYLVCRPGNI